MTRRRIRDAWREIAALGLALACLFFLWDTPLLYPLKMLVVFFHEISHGLAALATGGAVERIVLVPQEGGYCVTRGGNAFLVLSAGYLGSLLWGVLLLLVSARGRASRGVLTLLGTGMLCVALAWVRPILDFGFAFTAGMGLLCVVLAQRLPEKLCGFLVRLVGLCNCAYAILDIKSDVLDRPGIRSDAYLLGELTGISATIWGTAWIAAALLATAVALVFTVRLAARGRGR